MTQADKAAGAAALPETLSLEVSGVPVSVERATLADDIETLELLADAEDGDAFAVVRLMRHVFGEEQYANVKASLRKGGRTSVTDMLDFMGELFAQIGESAKN